jgi:hypothetical protein
MNVSLVQVVVFGPVFLGEILSVSVGKDWEMFWPMYAGRDTPCIMKRSSRPGTIPPEHDMGSPFALL